MQMLLQNISYNLFRKKSTLQLKDIKTVLPTYFLSNLMYQISDSARIFGVYTNRQTVDNTLHISSVYSGFSILEGDINKQCKVKSSTRYFKKCTWIYYP